MVVGRITEVCAMYWFVMDLRWLPLKLSDHVRLYKRPGAAETMESRDKFTSGFSASAVVSQSSRWRAGKKDCGLTLHYPVYCSNSYMHMKYFLNEFFSASMKLAQHKYLINDTLTSHKYYRCFILLVNFLY